MYPSPFIHPRVVPCSARRCCCGPSPMPRICWMLGRPRRMRWWS